MTDHATTDSPGSLRERTEELIRRAAALEENSSRRFDSAPGSAVTGSAGRRRSGLAKKTDRAITGSLNDLAKARGLRARAARLQDKADRLDPVKIAEAAARKATKAETRKRAKAAESARLRALPIVNDPSGQLQLTRDGWKRESSSSKLVMEGDGYRFRVAMRGGSLVSVFITDAPVRLSPTTTGAKS